MFRSDRDRFDKFTERARKVLSLAHEEAQRAQKNYIGTEYLLLGLVREGEGVAARVLQALGVELARVRTLLEEMAIPGLQQDQTRVGLTPQAKKAVELAVDEARRLNHHYIGTEHLLLGLLRLPESGAVQILSTMGLAESAIRAQTMQMLTLTAQSDDSGEVGPASGRRAPWSDNVRFDKFNPDARKALALAQEEAQRFQHNYIGTEHQLLGLVRLDESVAGRVLKQLGIELHAVRSAVEFIIGRGDRVVLGEIGLTPRAKKVIELAVDEARLLRHQYIGSEHILLGLVREGHGIAAGVLESLGVKLEQVRTATLQVLGQGEGLFKLINAYILSKKPVGPQISGVQDADDLVPEPTGEEERGNIVTIRARRVLARGRDEALHYQQERVGTEHLLLSLVKEQNGLAFHVLRNQGIEIERILTATRFLIDEEKLSEPGNVDGLSTDCKKAIDLAIDEAWQMSHTAFGTEHLLLGLLASEGIASGVLITRGLTLDKARAEILRLMGL